MVAWLLWYGKPKDYKMEALVEPRHGLWLTPRAVSLFVFNVKCDFHN